VVLDDSRHVLQTRSSGDRATYPLLVFASCEVVTLGPEVDRKAADTLEQRAAHYEVTPARDALFLRRRHWFVAEIVARHRQRINAVLARVVNPCGLCAVPVGKYATTEDVGIRIGRYCVADLLE